MLKLISGRLGEVIGIGRTIRRITFLNYRAVIERKP